MKNLTKLERDEILLFPTNNVRAHPWLRQLGRGSDNQEPRSSPDVIAQVSTCNPKFLSVLSPDEFSAKEHPEAEPDHVPVAVLAVLHDVEYSSHSRIRCSSPPS